ncbi:hypothetical protein, partial [Streptomyces hydrogenans]|uniref:hypothetical protein n=1 Tax=Streptomyces hydrogenans TaxID=1873719 RepID=UPI00365627ED
MIDTGDIDVFLGLDVGKGEHHATAVTPVSYTLRHLHSDFLMPLAPCIGPAPPPAVPRDFTVAPGRRPVHG